jgi:hypothetical protein
MGLGRDIASKMPAPDELDDVMSESGDEPDGDEDADAAAEASAMEEFAGALKGGSIEDKVAAFKQLLSTCKGY